MYKIKYLYRTGNSFGSEDCEDILEYEWEDYKFAKESLQRIKEHYEWYESIEDHFGGSKQIPKWHNVSMPEKWMEDQKHHIINLRINETDEVQFWCPWCGYFEHLYGAEIITDDKITID